MSVRKRKKVGFDEFGSLDAFLRPGQIYKRSYHDAFMLVDIKYEFNPKDGYDHKLRLIGETANGLPHIEVFDFSTGYSEYTTIDVGLELTHLPGF